MSYIPRPPALGNVIGDVLGAASNVVQDPCLGQVAGMVLQLHDLDQQSLNPFAPRVPTQPPSAGIGLCSAVTPLSYVIWIKSNPAVAAAGILGVVALLVGVGYSLGRNR